MTRDQIEDEIRRLKDAHAEDEGNFNYRFNFFLYLGPNYIVFLVYINNFVRI